MNISTLWIQILSYIASLVAGALGLAVGTELTKSFPDMSQQLSAAFLTISAAGPGYFAHHYLDGLLTAHKAAIASGTGTVAGTLVTDTGSGATAPDAPVTVGPSTVGPPPAGEQSVQVNS